MPLPEDPTERQGYQYCCTSVDDLTSSLRCAESNGHLDPAVIEAAIRYAERSPAYNKTRLTVLRRYLRKAQNVHGRG
jgi:hypothetical protein